MQLSVISYHIWPRFCLFDHVCLFDHSCFNSFDRGVIIMVNAMNELSYQLPYGG